MRGFGASRMYPLSSLSYMLLVWQGGKLEEATLSDSDQDDDGDNGDGEPVVRHTTEEEYDSYVPSPIPPLIDQTDHLCRRLKRIQTHHISLSITALFERHPYLETYLRANFDEKLIAEVHRFTSLLCTPNIHVLTMAQMSKLATNQRAVDTNKVQTDILRYLQPSPKLSLGIDVPASLAREQQGLGHKITSRFLIPHQYLDAFESSPDRSVCIIQWSPPLTTPPQRPQQV